MNETPKSIKDVEDQCLRFNQEQLARKFASILNGWLTPEQRADVVRLNKAENNPAICHSHDFCDANQAMINALEAFGIDYDCTDEAQGALIDAAWAMAKANNFWFVMRGNAEF